MYTLLNCVPHFHNYQFGVTYKPNGLGLYVLLYYIASAYIWHVTIIKNTYSLTIELINQSLLGWHVYVTQLKLSKRV
jgi:hypothetical protein